MLDQSAKELRITVEELEKRYEAIENEGIIFCVFKIYNLFYKCLTGKWWHWV